jgi:hypothetical protein
VTKVLDMTRRRHAEQMSEGQRQYDKWVRDWVTHDNAFAAEIAEFLEDLGIEVLLRDEDLRRKLDAMSGMQREVHKALFEALARQTLDKFKWPDE